MIRRTVIDLIPCLFQPANLGQSDGCGQADSGQRGSINQQCPLCAQRCAQRAHAQRLARAAALWSEVEARRDAPTAWQALLGALLRDPDFVSY